MRFGTTKDGIACAIINSDRVVALDGSFGYAFDTLQSIIDQFAAGALDISGVCTLDVNELPSVHDFDWAAPLPRPNRNIFCVGKNYTEHAKEFSDSGFDSSAMAGEDIPDCPIIFTKAPETVIGPTDTIQVPSQLTKQVDYEAEIAVVVGQSGRFIPEAEAMEHVFGYTLVNDVTARDLQWQHKQWFLGKSIETFCPMGPFIVMAQGVDPSTLDVTCSVNGKMRQSAVASDMIFDIASIVSTISRSMTLLPGDIIAMGTPAGVAIGMNPPSFLQHGDVVSVASSQLGELRNPVSYL